MEFTAIRERLLKRREELRSRTQKVGADLRHEREPLSADFADQAIQRGNDDVLEAISQSAQDELRRIEIALRRIDEQRYDVCSVCGDEIGIKRLETVPYADRCARCAERGESARP